MTKRITISVPDEIADKAQRAADSGQVESVSAYFAELAQREPDWAAAREILDELGTEVEVTEEDREQARAALGLDDMAELTDFPESDGGDDVKSAA